MAKVTKATVDASLRNRIFANLIYGENAFEEEMNYQKINDRQYGILLTDENGVQRYCRISVIVAEERDTMTAEELMQSEIDAYRDNQAKKEAKAEKARAKAERDKARRQKKEEEEKEETV